MSWEWWYGKKTDSSPLELDKKVDLEMKVDLEEKIDFRQFCSLIHLKTTVGLLPIDTHRKAVPVFDEEKLKNHVGKLSKPDESFKEIEEDLETETKETRSIASKAEVSFLAPLLEACVKAEFNNAQTKYESERVKKNARFFKKWRMSIPEKELKSCMLDEVEKELEMINCVEKAEMFIEQYGSLVIMDCELGYGEVFFQSVNERKYESEVKGSIGLTGKTSGVPGGSTEAAITSSETREEMKKASGIIRLGKEEEKTMAVVEIKGFLPIYALTDKESQAAFYLKSVMSPRFGLQGSRFAIVPKSNLGKAIYHRPEDGLTCEYFENSSVAMWKFLVDPVKETLVVTINHEVEHKQGSKKTKDIWQLCGHEQKTSELFPEARTSVPRRIDFFDVLPNMLPQSKWEIEELKQLDFQVYQGSLRLLSDSRGTGIEKKDNLFLSWSKEGSLKLEKFRDSEEKPQFIFYGEKVMYKYILKNKISEDVEYFLIWRNNTAKLTSVLTLEEDKKLPCFQEFSRPLPVKFKLKDHRGIRVTILTTENIPLAFDGKKIIVKFPGVDFAGVEELDWVIKRTDPVSIPFQIALEKFVESKSPDQELESEPPKCMKNYFEFQQVQLKEIDDNKERSMSTFTLFTEDDYRDFIKANCDSWKSKIADAIIAYKKPDILVGLKTQIEKILNLVINDPTKIKQLDLGGMQKVVGDVPRSLENDCFLAKKTFDKINEDLEKIGEIVASEESKEMDWIVKKVPQLISTRDSSRMVISIHPVHADHMCLDVEGRQLDSGRKVHLYKWKHQRNQMWIVERHGDLFALKAFHSRFYLTFTNFKVHELATQSTFNTKTKMQLFGLDRGGSPEKPFFRIKMKKRDKEFYVDISGKKSCDTAEVQLYHSTKELSQRFFFYIRTELEE